MLIGVFLVQNGLNQGNVLWLLTFTLNSKSARKSGRIVNGWNTISVWSVLMISIIWRQHKWAEDDRNTRVRKVAGLEVEGGELRWCMRSQLISSTCDKFVTRDS